MLLKDSYWMFELHLVVFLCVDHCIIILYKQGEKTRKTSSSRLKLIKTLTFMGFQRIHSWILVVAVWDHLDRERYKTYPESNTRRKISKLQDSLSKRCQDLLSPKGGHSKYCLLPAEGISFPISCFFLDEDAEKWIQMVIKTLVKRKKQSW